MDPMSLAAMAAPIIIKGAEAFSKSAGEKLGEKIDQLSQAAINKFKGDSYAEKTLIRAREKPNVESRQSALEEILAEKMLEDQDFAEKMRLILDELQNDGTRSLFDQRGQTVNGPQTNINKANAPVFSGIINGSVNIENQKN
jgi:hypothetical protein